MTRTSLHIFSLIFFLFTFWSASAQPPNRITLGCKQYFLNGANVAWSNAGGEDHYGWDFAIRPWDGVTPGYNAAWWDAHFAMLQTKGVNCVRIKIHADGRADPEYSGSNISGPDPILFSSLDDMLNKARNRNIMVILCLWDGVTLNGTTKRDVVFNVAQTNNYINNVLTPMANRYKNQCNLLAYDIINEPEHMYENCCTGAANKTAIQRFVAMCAEAIHNVDTKIMVTVGSKSMQYNTDLMINGNSRGNWYKDSELQAAYPAGNTARTKLDFYSPHYYNWMNDPGNGWDFAPYKRTTAAYLLDKPTIIGETANRPAETVSWTHQQMLDVGYTNGYAGVLFWASSAASGGGAAWTDFDDELLNFRNAYTSIVDYTCAASCCTQPNLGPNVILCGGVSSTTLNSNAGSTTNKTYKWYRNSVLIGGATSSTYGPTSTPGTYVVEVDSMSGLCVLKDTVIVSNTLTTPNIGPNTNLCTPASVNLDGGNYGATPVTYQWFKNAAPITGETTRYLNNVRSA
ncbi:MAG: glycoside hydrolase family 5 protein, partial [Cytophagaceae bacterium]|nr:glycoside hydrolase family 5 protein [Cytophagaceae bacterium]